MSSQRPSAPSRSDLDDLIAVCRVEVHERVDHDQRVAGKLLPVGFVDMSKGGRTHIVATEAALYPQ